TCSLLREENEDQVAAFLARYPMFKRVEVGAPAPEALHGPQMRLSPKAHGTDGFFAAVMERDAEPERVGEESRLG
ncbi:MAG TPA: rRNA cytosine-C5-methylase, partial [Acidocella sp.]|nr:rRNA cytosine-C5-methylase [Acidocella sp.]